MHQPVGKVPTEISHYEDAEGVEPVTKFANLSGSRGLWAVWKQSLQPRLGQGRGIEKEPEDAVGNRHLVIEQRRFSEPDVTREEVSEKTLFISDPVVNPERKDCGCQEPWPKDAVFGSGDIEQRR